MVKVVVYENRPGFPVLDALVEGIPGAVKRPANEWEPCDVAVIFGSYKPADPLTWPKGDVIEKTRTMGGRVLVAERGYIKRAAYVSLGWDAINGRADFCNQDSPPDRWRLLRQPLRDWQTDTEGPVILAGQVPWDASVQMHDHVEWCRKIYSHLRRRRIDVEFRPHPKALKRGAVYHRQLPIPSAIPNLRATLRRARAAVTFSSNFGVDAVLAGVPTIAMDEGSMVYGYAGSDLRALDVNTLPFDRTAWANDIAYAQWTPAEIALGQAWEHIKKGAPC